MAAMLSQLAEAPAPYRELEHGRVTFVARPKIDSPGVQSFMVVLSTADEHAHRRIVIGKKHLPRAGMRDREWSYVAKVGATQRDVLEGLGPSTYMTKTKGLRHQAGARAVATGTYRLREHGSHTHLDYELDRGLDYESDDEREHLERLHVQSAGSLIVAVFNPLVKWSREATLRYGGSPDDPAPFVEPSIFPDELQATFGERRFAPLVPEFLDYEGAELVLLDGGHVAAR